MSICVMVYAQDCPPEGCPPGPAFSCPGEVDCSLLKCGRLPPCADGEILGTLPGACCARCLPKKCQLNCDRVRCAFPVCKKGFVAKQVFLYAQDCPLEGCPPGPSFSCPGEGDCRLVKCARLPPCAEGEILGTLPGACCPRCLPKDCELNCDRVRCAFPVCNRGSVAKQVFLYAQKCPPGPSFSCPGEVDCKVVRCGALPTCANGEILGTLPGACCPRCLPKDCELNCDAVRCAFPICKKGTVAKPVFSACVITLANYCNDTGEIDCRAVLCSPVNCPPHQIEGIIPGRCCPTCLPKDCELNCDAVRCAFPLCVNGTVPRKLFCKCCLQCVRCN
ncbi:unnamed protein product [Diabrotica balteata]|uniref:Uncharacterized protein n=1 Tax=Diabrotica balteata TaxID=107213 RepID=A0A9N9SNI8_DIABA|nr:unnamed protein product [Diabrotica balteata]